MTITEHKDIQSKMCDRVEPVNLETGFQNSASFQDFGTFKPVEQQNDWLDLKEIRSCTFKDEQSHIFPQVLWFLVKMKRVNYKTGSRPCESCGHGCSHLPKKLQPKKPPTSDGPRYVQLTVVNESAPTIFQRIGSMITGLGLSHITWIRSLMAILTQSSKPV